MANDTTSAMERDEDGYALPLPGEERLRRLFPNDPVVATPKKDHSVYAGLGLVLVECPCGEFYKDHPQIRWTLESELGAMGRRNLIYEDLDDDPIRGAFWLVWFECPRCEYPEFETVGDDWTRRFGSWRELGAVPKMIFEGQAPFIGGVPPKTA